MKISTSNIRIDIYEKNSLEDINIYPYMSMSLFITILIAPSYLYILQIKKCTVSLQRWSD